MSSSAKMSSADKPAESVVVMKMYPLGNDLKENPSCEHGPCILIQRNEKTAYVCSAFRDRRLCPYYVAEEDFKKNPEKYMNRKPLSFNPVGVAQKGNKQNGKGHAQYFFSDASRDWICQALWTWRITDMICMGAPTIHKYFHKNSILMDIDASLADEADDGKFVHYNMFNHHFFGSDQVYRDFIKNVKGNLVVFCDPPFGARLELLINTFNLISYDRSQLGLSPVSAILINPYYSEGKLKQLGYGLKMSTFRVEYLNHPKFSKGSSPVRIFTNFDMTRLPLPETKYGKCSKCQKTDYLERTDCISCKGACIKAHCPGKRYQYCKICKACVSTAYQHCGNCGVCHKLICPRTHKRAAPVNWR